MNMIELFRARASVFRQDMLRELSKIQGHRLFCNRDLLVEARSMTNGEIAAFIHRLRSEARAFEAEGGSHRW